jgi:hypothetical protein
LADDYIKKVFGIKESACFLDYYIDDDDKRRWLHNAPSFPAYITQGDLSQKGPEFLVDAVTMGTRGLQYLVRTLKTIPMGRYQLEDMVKGMRLIAAALTRAQEERLKSRFGLSDHDMRDMSDESKFPRSVRTALAASYFRGGPGDSAFPGRPAQPQPPPDASAQAAARAFYPFPVTGVPCPPPFYYPFGPYGPTPYPQPPPAPSRPPSPSKVTPPPALSEPDRPATPPPQDKAPVKVQQQPGKDNRKQDRQPHSERKPESKRGGP